MDLLSKLNKGLKFGAGSGNPAKMTHENETAILDAATHLLERSETGKELLDFAKTHRISIHVLKNKSDFGVLPGESTVYISCPAGQRMPSSRAAIHLAGALREAMQNAGVDGLAKPNLRTEPKRYGHTYGERKVDQLFWQTAVVYELAEVNGLSEIIDEFGGMGYLNVYEAYKADLNGRASS